MHLPRRRFLMMTAFCMMFGRPAFADEARDLLDAMNRRRFSMGMKPMRLDDRLQRIAQQQVEIVAQNGALRAGPDWIPDALRREGYKGVADVAYGQNDPSADAAVEAWVGTYNLDEKFKRFAVMEAGVGYTRRGVGGGRQVPYWLMILARPAEK